MTNRLAAHIRCVYMVIDMGFPLLARNLVEYGLAWGCGPRRSTLDTLLIDAAIENGVEFRDV